ncbi:MAG: hypothetical protein JWM75_221 [Sphingomonas bacterium]|jgi:hypothetical protein|nr:hypothetical protein [Sphingomonas bacterium]
MSGDQWAGLLAGAAALTLVGSALLARRLPAKRIVVMAAAWAAIFGGAVLIARLLA